MKKITLLLLLVITTASFSFAQNLKIIYQGGNGAYYNDSIILVFGSSSSTLITSPTFDVINKSGDTTNIWVKRTIISHTATDTNAICFAGYCGAKTLSTSKYSVFLGVGDTAQLINAFYGDFYPSGQNGTTVIRYTFYNWNYADSGSFIIQYSSTPTGIARLSGGQIGFSAPYPNPASNTVNFSYSLSGEIHSADLKIYNLLGECIQTVPLNVSKNKTLLNVQSLPSGIYVCAVVANGCQPAYQKMIVSH